MTSIRAASAVSLFAAILVAGCGAPSPAPSPGTPPTQSGNPNVKPSTATATAVGEEQPTAEPDADAEATNDSDGDFSTPQAAVQTFIAASAARDLDLLSRCFAEGAPREFDGLRKKTATPEELDQLVEFMQGARITDVRINDSAGTAVVDVKLTSRDEHMSMRKIDTGWKLVDF
jgi:hypothetical protein